MEAFGMCFALPFGMVISLGYAWLTAHIDWRWLRRLMISVSALVVLGMVIEWRLLATLGALAARQQFGGAFVLLHVIVFLLGTGGLINLLTLPWYKPSTMRWIAAGLLGGLLFWTLVLIQYSVAEAWYGADDIGGPYSARPFPPTP